MAPPSTCVVQDCQSIREAVQVVVSEVQRQGLAGFSWDEAPNSVPALKVQENWHPLQKATHCTSIYTALYKKIDTGYAQKYQ